MKVDTGRPRSASGSAGTSGAHHSSLWQCALLLVVAAQMVATATSVEVAAGSAHAGGYSVAVRRAHCHCSWAATVSTLTGATAAGIV